MFFEVSALGPRPVLLAIFILLCGALLKFLFEGYKARMRFVELQRLGMPMPPHSFIFGHMLMYGKVAAKLGVPSDVHGHYIPTLLRKAYPDLPSVFYLDFWPFGMQFLMVGDPGVAAQFTQDISLPKFDGLKHYMRPITGDKDLLTMEGQEWKRWRAVFNPGFTPGHLMTLVPGIVEDTLTFRSILLRHAQNGDLFSLEEVITGLTVDVIGRAVLGAPMNAQNAPNDLVRAFRRQVKHIPSGDEVNPFKKYQPWRRFIYWYNTRVQNAYISRELDKRFVLRGTTQSATGTKRSKPIIDIALDVYLEGKKQDNATSNIDEGFKILAIDQIKLFLFAGHDTTSSTLAYVFHLLSTHPDVTAKLCAEHDSVFGTDLTQTADLINNNPYILNKLPYTVAVIKETLRLFPAASSLRQGQPSFHLNVSGRQFPTDGYTLWSIHKLIHHNPSLWPQVDEFIPERHLVPEGNPLFPVKGALRPFEFGPRNCIGQELAMLESRLILAMTVREFDIRSDYEGFDRRTGKKRATVCGERAYQVLLGSAKPSDHMPARVSLRKR